MSDEDAARNVSIYFVLFSAILAFVLILAKQVHKYPQISTVLSEASIILIVGMIAGCIVNQFFVIDVEFDDIDDEKGENVGVANSLLSFQENVFYLGLLPPILFNSGFQLRRELFYRHIKPILLFAVLGTIISAYATALLLYGIQQFNLFGGFNPELMELITFGSMIAATDTVSVLAVFQAMKVDPHLFYVCFGESALNDAVAIVLFRTCCDFLVKNLEDPSDMAREAGYMILDALVQGVCSPILGAVFVFCAALLFKSGDMRDTPLLELSLYMILMYIPFIVAETFNLSGIVTIFFSGMSARRYVHPNISDETKKVASTIFKLAAYLAEACIFLELGLSVFGFRGKFVWEFIVWAFIAALVGRAVAVYPVAYIYNFSLHKVKNGNGEVVDDLESIAWSTAESVTSGSAWPYFHMPQKREDKKIPVQMMHVLWFAGLRGAVAYACVREFPDVNNNRHEFVAATMVIVLVTIIGMGGGTKSLLKCLRIRMNVDEEEYMKNWHKQRKLKGTFHSLEHRFVYQVAVREQDRSKSEGGIESHSDQQSGGDGIAMMALDDTVRSTYPPEMSPMDMSTGSGLIARTIELPVSNIHGSGFPEFSQDFSETTVNTSLAAEDFEAAAAAVSETGLVVAPELPDVTGSVVAPELPDVPDLPDVPPPSSSSSSSEGIKEHANQSSEANPISTTPPIQVDVSQHIGELPKPLQGYIPPTLPPQRVENAGEGEAEGGDGEEGGIGSVPSKPLPEIL